MRSPVTAAASERTTVSELAALFLKLGTIAFGGPAAHVAMMEDEVVRRRRWLTRQEFLDYVGATNLIPGPNSTELAIHIGHSRAGWPGLIVAGVCFILPAALIVTAFAWAYVRFGSLPEVSGILYGVKPVVIAVVLQALIGLGRSALKTSTLMVVGAICLIAAFAGIDELLILLGAALSMIAARAMNRERASIADMNGVALAARFPATRGALPIGGSAVAATASASVPFGLWPLFLVFLKVGSVLFGSGYVLIAFLRADLVQHLGWLTERQLLDAVAVGQVTPGPVFTTATFIGYLLGGGRGAAVATIGIFLPAFIFVALSGLVLPRLQRSPMTRAVLDGVNVASLALMAAVAFQLARTALTDWLTVSIAIISTALLLRRINSTWLVSGGALIGLAATLLRT